MTTPGQWPPSEHGEKSEHGENGPPGGENIGVNDTGADPTADPPPRTGSINFQDASNTTPREPTLAEQRAREHAAKQQQESEAAWWDEQQRHAKRRKRILIGGAVGIGLVAVIAISYSASHPSQARCVGPNNVVVDDSNCVTPVANDGYGGYLSGGGFYPIFLGGGGQQYHYNYGGSGGIGQVATGGTTVPPRGTVTTTSGRTINPGSSSYGSSSGGGSGSDSGSSTVRRGGFGVNSHGSSGGG